MNGFFDDIMRIADTSGNIVTINENGSLNVVTTIIEPPDTSTPITNGFQFGEVSGSSEETYFYLIPLGKKMYITYFEGASQDPDRCSCTSLWYYPNGESDDTNAELITLPFFLNGRNDRKNMDYVSPTGDGTAGIMMIRKADDSQIRNIGGEIRGYYL